MLLIALATWVSEDLACIGAGLLAARGVIGFGPAVAAAFIGLVSGDILLFLAGRWLGRPALGRAPLKWFIPEAAVLRAARWFEARGPVIILASRFAPGSLLPAYCGAGMVGCPLGTFALYFSLACLLWTPLLVGLAMLVGHQVLAAYAHYQQYALAVLAATVAVLLVAARILPALFSYRGRRLLLAARRRRTRWEFWPTPLLYVPVVIYIVWLGLRHRCPTLFTAVNPGIPAGGVTGESKLAILESLRASGAVAPFAAIAHTRPLSAQADAVDAFMAAQGVDFPVVLKPDVGHRGQGVQLVRSGQAVRAYLAAARGDTIVQAYVEGREYGVFYGRFPGEPRGQIFSITDKRRLFLTGDGRHTLEELILRDERAVCLAPLHFAVHQADLMDVPPAGAVVPLVEVGTHARGALFLDARPLVTPAMTRAFDTISRSFEGFYFGRYDVRVPSQEDFQAGRNIRVLELNGVTSEATHVYDPDYTLRAAWRDLMAQWRIAFEISARNKARGIAPLSIPTFMRLVFSGVPADRD